MTLTKTKNGEAAIFDQMVDTILDVQWPRFTYATVPFDLYEKEGKYFVELPVPGFDAKEIDVEVNGNTVSIAGTHAEKSENKDARYHRREIRRGSFSRSVSLPQELDPNKVEATIEKGILRLTLMPVVPFAFKKIEVRSV